MRLVKIERNENVVTDATEWIRTFRDVDGSAHTPNCARKCGMFL